MDWRGSPHREQSLLSVLRIPTYIAHTQSHKYFMCACLHVFVCFYKGSHACEYMYHCPGLAVHPVVAPPTHTWGDCTMFPCSAAPPSRIQCVMVSSSETVSIMWEISWAPCSSVDLYHPPIPPISAWNAGPLAQAM